MRFTNADWQRLRDLRDRFLTDASADYWTARDLELYDATFAQRIGWKWDAVLHTLKRLGWRPRATRILDWGCGTGIATRAVAEWYGIRKVEVYDQSAVAMRFAIEALKQRGLDASPANLRDGTVPGDSLLLISHVVGELKPEERKALAHLAATASEVIWVEPGSRDISRQLTDLRQILLDAGHHMIAPCTHDRLCPMTDAPRDWCHFFAKSPAEIFQSAFWREFSERLEIDLRALPYSFLASSKHFTRPLPAEAERLIGRPHVLKAHCELLCCGAEGLAVRTLRKRDDSELFRRVTRKGLSGVFACRNGKVELVTGDSD